MTVIAVADGKIYIDSQVTFGGLRMTKSKVTRTTKGAFAVTGHVSAGAQLAHQFTAFKGPDSEFECPFDAADFTTVYFKRKDGLIFIIDVVLGSKWALVPQDEGLVSTAGSGQDFLLAYHAMFNDVAKSIELAAVNHVDCGLPIEVL